MDKILHCKIMFCIQFNFLVTNYAGTSQISKKSNKTLDHDALNSSILNVPAQKCLNKHHHYKDDSSTLPADKNNLKSALLLDPLEEVEIAHVLWWIRGGPDLTIIKYHPSLILSHVGNVMPTVS